MNRHHHLIVAAAVSRLVYLLLLLAIPASFVHALPPTALEARLKPDAKITVVDVRSPALYEKAHIPGAINIPAALCPDKKLPPLGEVVVYDDGLGQNEAEAAAAALNGKPGIKAQILEGGFAAWQQLRGKSTEAPGMKSDQTPMISYSQLKSAQSNGVVLVDLRKRPGRAGQQARQGASTEPAPESLSDLRKVFPGAPSSLSPFNLPETRQSSSGVPPLLVLIDSGDGTAQSTAAVLKANGITRVTILAGGEAIIARGGQPGLQRVGSATPAPPAARKSTNP